MVDKDTKTHLRKQNWGQKKKDVTDQVVRCSQCKGSIVYSS